MPPVSVFVVRVAQTALLRYECVEEGSAAGTTYQTISLHGGPHQTVGSKTGSERGDVEDPITSPNDPLFMFHHNNLERNKLHWMRRNPELATTFYGYPVSGASALKGGAIEGMYLEDAASSAWGFTAADLGLGDDASTLLTHGDLVCGLDPKTAPYTFDDLETLPELVAGYVYCDNQFELYVNGDLVASDPLTFTPHQAVRVSFDYDGVSDKTYAILCQDYASDSGYEYTETNAQLGDGALIAEFSDGTVTSADWRSYVVSFGPTDASIADGCSSSNLGACAVEDGGAPDGWALPDFDDSAWAPATVYTAAQAGWGRTPAWDDDDGCCEPTSPMDMSSLGCCSCNYDLASGTSVAAAVSKNECLVPEAVLSEATASFLWGADLERDNKMLFRTTTPAPVSSSRPPTESPAPTPRPAPRPTAAPISPTPAPLAPTPRPSPAPTDAVVHVVVGSLTVAGVDLAAAVAEADVFVAAVADVAAVAVDAVTVELSAARRRRLSAGVVVAYTVEAASEDAAADLADGLAEATTTDFDGAIAAAAAGSPTFAAASTTALTPPEATTVAADDDAPSSSKKSDGADSASGSLVVVVAVVAVLLVAGAAAAVVVLRNGGKTRHDAEETKGVELKDASEIEVFATEDEGI